MKQINIKDGDRYLIQISFKQDSFLYNMWDYVESVKTLKEAEKICDGLYDNSIHKLQISDTVKNIIVKSWDSINK